MLAHQSGLLLAADWSGEGGVAFVDPATDTVHRHTARTPGAGLRPNGIRLEDGGSILLAHLGDDEGGVYRLHPDGSHEPVLTEVEGRPLPPTNFVAKDGLDRLYVTVSTRQVPRHAAAHAGARDGFIVMKPPVGPPRIVADALGYTNECVFDVWADHLYVNETFGRSTCRFAVHPDGSLGERQLVARFGDGIYPDGLVFDAEGGLWITSIISNTVLRVRPDGERTLVVQDRDPDRVAAVERAYAAGTLDRGLLDAPHGGPLKNISSLAFGGPGLSTANLGCLLGDSIASFPAPVPGARPAHFDADLSPLVAQGVLPKGLAG